MLGYDKFPSESGDESEELLVVEPASPNNAHPSGAAATRNSQPRTTRNNARPLRFPVASVSSASVASNSEVEETLRPSRLSTRSAPSKSTQKNNITKRAGTSNKQVIEEILDVNPNTDKIKVRYSDGTVELVSATTSSYLQYALRGTLVTSTRQTWTFSS